MTGYLGSERMLSDRQSGFRKGHSCITALVDVAEEIRREVDDGKVAFLLLLDHSRAFDTVDHSILSYKLRKFFNFSPTSSKLLSTYLSDRFQYVVTQNGQSVPLPVTRGVPQGSIVGPLLFSMYSNDLPKILINCKVRMYADDVQLYTSCSIDMADQCILSLNRELLRINTWATANGLSINPRKSKCIVIQKRLSHHNIKPDLYINGQLIDIVGSAKNLGIIFNSSLTWSDHVNYACGRTFAILRGLWATQHCTPFRIRKLLAKSYLIPSFIYGCELFARCDASSKRRLNVAYNCIIRYVYGLKRRSRISAFSSLLYGFSFECLLNFRVLIFLHKIIYTRQPDHLFNKLSFTHNCRGKRIRTLIYRTLVSQWQFFVFAVQLWNSIPYSYQGLSNARQFKSKLIELFSE